MTNDKSVNLVVVVRATIPLGALNPNDTNVAGAYKVQLPTDTDPSDYVEVALEWFHGWCPIKVLDDFDITVEKDGVDLEHLALLEGGIGIWVKEPELTYDGDPQALPEVKNKTIVVQWVPDNPSNSLMVTTSDHPRYKVGTGFAWTLFRVAAAEGYTIVSLPLHPLRFYQMSGEG
jgi:hypothetical protein